MEVWKRSRTDRLETLELSFKTSKLSVDVEWFRALVSTAVPNRSWHFHTNVETHFVLEGCVRFYFQGQGSEPNRYVDVSGGNVLLIPANMPHRLENASALPYYRMVLNAGLTPSQDDPEGQLVSQALQVDQPKLLPLSAQVNTLLEACIRESSAEICGYVSVIQCHLHLIVWQLARDISQSPRAEYAVKKRLDYISQRAAQIYRYVSDNIERNPSCKDIAEHIHLSTKQVQRVVSQLYGMAVKELVIDVRLKRSKSLLKDSALSLATIASMVGLSNEQSFCRFFRQMEGQTPHQYRIGAIPPQRSASEDAMDAWMA